MYYIGREKGKKVFFKIMMIFKRVIIIVLMSIMRLRLLVG